MPLTGFALVPTPTRPGPKPRLDDIAFRDRLLMMAASGCSRQGVAAQNGMRKQQLTEWLAKGQAQPDLEPWGSFSRAYLAAERLLEPGITQGLAMQVAHVLRKAPDMRTMAEVQFLRQELALRFPVEHGSAGAGTGQMRQVDAEPDPEAWWQKHGLEGDQLRALLRDPPESVAAALVAEADAVYARLLESGWKPKTMR